MGMTATSAPVAPASSPAPSNDGAVAIAGVTGSTVCTCFIGGTYLTCQPASHASAAATVTVSIPAAMIGARSTSRDIPRIAC